MCHSMGKSKTLKTIEIQCVRSLEGRSVTITLKKSGYLSLCEVAVYADHVQEQPSFDIRMFTHLSCGE